MTSEEQTKADLLTLVQGRNQRIAELELLVLGLNRKLQEVTNAGNEEKTDEEGNEEEVLLKPLDRRAFGILSSLMSTDPVGAIEGVIGMLCVSENKEAILSDDSTLMSLATPIAEMMNTKTASLKKN